MANQDPQGTKKPGMIEDFGEKIGRARKDLWQRRGLNLDDLLEMKDTERAVFVIKDHVWAKPDYAGLIDSGVEPVAAHLLKVVRDSLPAKPIRPEQCEDYVTIVGNIRDAFAQAKTVAEVRKIYPTFRASWRTEGDRDFNPEGYKMIRAMGNNTFRKIQMSGSVVRKAEREIEGGWPRKMEAWEMRARSKGFSFTQTEEGWSALRYGRPLREAFKEEEAAKAFLRNFMEENGFIKAPKPGKAEEPRPPHLEKVERLGLTDYRHGRDVRESDFQETFGFRGGEFGNWVGQAERQVVLNMAYDSLRDLSFVLGVDPQAISLHGSLAIAFGARGSGNAHAHYEPGLRVINLTKIKGAGCLAHEWFHAFDHFASCVANKSSLDTSYLVESAALHRKESLPPGFASAYKDLTAAMAKRQLSPEETETLRNNRRSTYLTSSKNWAEAMANSFARGPRSGWSAPSDATALNFREVAAKAIEQPGERKWISEIAGMYHSATGRDATKYAEFVNFDRAVTALRYLDETPEKAQAMGRSRFSEEAAKIDRDFRAKPYWSTGRELGARAFHDFVHASLGEGRNDYLAYRPYEFTVRDITYRPFPKSAQERAKIHGSFQAVFKAARENAFTLPNGEVKYLMVPMPPAPSLSDALSARPLEFAEVGRRALAVS